jgi:hypothetical protein
MKPGNLLPAVVFPLLLSACALAAASPTPTPTAAPTATATDTAVPPAPTPTETPSPTETLTATPFAPYDVVVASHDAANIRSGPGYLFSVLRQAVPGTKLLLLGKAPGGEWFYVKVNDFVSGWVFGKLLRPDGEMQNAPLREPEDAKLVRGRVIDANGIPIRGVVFNVTQKGRPVNLNVVVTDADGIFYSYLPVWAAGWWTATQAGIACDSNVWEGSDCSVYKSGYRGVVKPLAADVRLPQEEILEFTWT